MKKQTIQIVVIASAVAVTGYLYSLKPVRLQTAEKSGHNNGMVAGSKPAPATAVNVEALSATAKTAIGPNLSVHINELEGQLKTAQGTEKTSLQLQLAKAWDNVSQPAPAAFYYQAAAKSENKFDDWLQAGNRFNSAFRVTQDSTLQATMLAGSVEAFTKATAMQPNNLEAKTGLGVAYVNGGAPSPMQGISLLLEVVGKDPNNWNANFNLGLFSMKSGQFDKAVIRFTKLIEMKSGDKRSIEPYFYLAESYKQLGEKEKAIAAYTACKEMMSDDPEFTKQIDRYISELKH